MSIFFAIAVFVFIIGFYAQCEENAKIMTYLKAKDEKLYKEIKKFLKE